MRHHYIAINSYRSATDDGPSNTWLAYRVSPQRQREILQHGLPVYGQWLLHADGTREPARSTKGVRLATAKEIAECEAAHRRFGY